MIYLDTVPTYFGLTQGVWPRFKIHLAAYNGSSDPIDVAANGGFQEWIFWNKWRGGRGNNDFNRDFIFALIPIPHSGGNYVFGGIFKVVKRHDDWKETEIGYDLELDESTKHHIGRVIIQYYRKPGQGGRSFKMENHIERMTVVEVLDEPYRGIYPQS